MLLLFSLATMMAACARTYEVTVVTPTVAPTPEVERFVVKADEACTSGKPTFSIQNTGATMTQTEAIYYFYNVELTPAGCQQMVDDANFTARFWLPKLADNEYWWGGPRSPFPPEAAHTICLQQSQGNWTAASIPAYACGVDNDSK